MRKTAEMAAQDYCNYVNGNPATPAMPTYSAPAIDMGNMKRHAPKYEPIKVERKVFAGPHDLYDVIVMTAKGDVVCRKIGITAKGHMRYHDICKTFGLSIKPHAKAITYSTKAKAQAAETAQIAAVCQDKKWRRVGKEAFAPSANV